jgi:hypothetical protein
MKKTLVLAAILIVLLLVGRKWLLAKYDDFTVVLPTYPPIENVTWLEQNWTPEQRDWFHTPTRARKPSAYPMNGSSLWSSRRSHSPLLDL